MVRTTQPSRRWATLAGMRCAVCEHDNEVDRKFCGQCGARLAIVCPTCGHANPPADRFCGECGAAIGAQMPSPSVGAAVGTAIGGPLAGAPPEAERRLVTVLFVDLVGFTAASEDRDPEDVREFLSRYFDISREIIGRYGGTVEKFIGDAVMAVWGTPVANEDDAERAVRAAMDLVDAVPAIRVGSVGGLPARAGALTGEAAVTLAARGEGMVAGDLVNTASRLQSVAAPGTVLVGEATYRAASNGIAFEPAGDHVVKGKELPLAAWRAVRVVAGMRGMGRQTGIEPPFVGRDAEMQLLRDLYHATVRERRARLVSVIGVAGIGKSRLSWELLKYLDGLVEVLYWHQGRSPAYGDGVTFWALGEMVRRRAGSAETDDDAATREKVAAMLDQFVPDDDDRRWIAPRILALLGLEETPPGPREELFAAWRTFFERVADAGPVVMIFEDLHWADAGLIDFIESLVESTKGRPILVVTLARPELLERRPTWGAGQRTFTAIHLEPLVATAMTRLVEGMAPGLPDTAVRRIVGQADGIPLYAVETFRMLLDSGRLEAVDGGFRATGPLEKLDIPPTLHALIAARLDALAPEDRALLQSASVLGKTFTLQGLTAVSESAAEDVEPRLRAIIRRELIELDVDPRSPERGQYGFVQSVIREVAYGTLGRRERRARHLAAARFYETLGDDELAGILASHYVDAFEASPEGPEAEAVAAQARVTLRGAAERAIGLHSHDQAAALYRQALTVTIDPAERAVILERLADASYFGSHFDDATARLREAIAWYEANDRTTDAIRASTRLGAILLHEGEVAEGVSTLEVAAAMIEAGASVDQAVYAGLASELARAHWRNSQLPDVIMPWVEKALVAAEPLALAHVIAESLNTKAGVLADQGRLQESLALMRGAVHYAQAHGLVEAEMRARNNLLFIDVDDPASSLEIVLEGREKAKRIGLRDWERQLAAVSMGLLGWSKGDFDQCLAFADLFEGDDIPLSYRLSFMGVSACAAALRGDVPAARQVMSETAALRVGVSDPQNAYGAAFSEAFIEALAGRPDVAVATVTAALPGMTGTWLQGAYSQVAGNAILAGDEAALRGAYEPWRPTAPRGRYADTFIESFEGAIDIWEGRAAIGAARMRGAAEVLDSMGLHLDRVWVLLGSIRLLGPDDPYSRAAAEKALTIAAELRSPTLEALVATIIEASRVAMTSDRPLPSARPASRQTTGA